MDEKRHCSGTSRASNLTIVHNVHEEEGIVCQKFNSRMIGDEDDDYGYERATEVPSRRFVSTIQQLRPRSTREGYAWVDWGRYVEGGCGRRIGLRWIKDRGVVPRRSFH